jgi:hypothetical protein
VARFRITDGFASDIDGGISAAAESSSLPAPMSNDSAPGLSISR